MKVRLPCVGKHNAQDIRNSVLHHVSASVNKFYITCELPTGNLASYSATLQESGTVSQINASYVTTQFNKKNYKFSVIIKSM